MDALIEMESVIIQAPNFKIIRQIEVITPKITDFLARSEWE
jgi:hypothetical protein